jgi:AraC-like DNA-binding protein
MVRNVEPAAYEAGPQSAIAIGNEYPVDYVLAPHSHRRSQLLYSMTGVMTVGTEQGSWVVPPERAVWIPAGVTHEFKVTVGPVSTRSLYVDDDAARDAPKQCQVVGISPLMRSLLIEAVDLPLDYVADSRAGLVMALLLHELALMPVLPLSIPFPSDTRLAGRCRAFLADPASHATIDEWATSLGMSRRAFTRIFRQETGLSFAAWRQQACLFTALPRLAAGEAVTTVALDLGYDSPAAFTSMFKRLLGVPPSRYLKTGRN